MQFEVEEKKKDDSGILKLSASSMKTYSQCPLRYYYQYIKKAKRKEYDHFTLGSFCHKVLEIFHELFLKNKNPNVSLSRLMTTSFAKAKKDKEFKNIKPELLIEAKGLIADYLDMLKQTSVPKVKGIEKSFEIQIQDNVLVRGFLDRVDLMDTGKYHIVDYKTTKNAKYLDPFQLLIYGLWLNQEYPEIDEFDGSYILLRHKSKSKTYNFNKKDLEDCKKKIVTFAFDINNNIKNGDWKPNPSILCNWCEFSNLCVVNNEW